MNKYSVIPYQKESLFFLFVSVVFLSPVLFTSQTYFARDLTYLAHPSLTLAGELLQKGEFPLWNPYAFSGTPFFSNLWSQLAYPFTLLFYIFPFTSALKLDWLLHFFLGSFLTYLFLKKEHFQTIPAMLGSIAYGLSGLFVGRVEFLPHLSTNIWLPIMLLMADRTLLLSVTLALAFSAGHPPDFLLYLAILIGYWISKRIHIQKTFKVMAAVICLSAPLLLPALETAALSERGQGSADESIANEYALAPAELAGILHPSLTKKPEGENAPGERYFWIKIFHLGFLTVSLAGLGMILAWKAKHPFRILGFVVILAGGILSLGNLTPFFDILWRFFPPFRWFRYPPRFLFPAVFFLSFFAAFGAHSINKTLKGKIQIFIGIGLLFTVTFELLWIGWNIHPRKDSTYFRNKGPTISFLEKNLTENRFVHDPVSLRDFRARGPDPWLALKDNLYGLTNLPYHFKNARGYGESMPSKRHAQFWRKIESLQSASEAVPYFNALNIKYLVSTDPFPGKEEESITPSGYGPFLLEISQDSSPAFWTKIEPQRDILIKREKDDISWNLERLSASRIKLKGRSPHNGWVFIPETWAPGWKAYTDKKRPLQKAGIAFQKIRISKDTEKFYLVYRPLSFITGLLVGILFLIYLGSRSLSLLCNFVKLGL